MTVLNEQTLAQLNRLVPLPRYHRRQVTTEIVHVSVGKPIAPSSAGGSASTTSGRCSASRSRNGCSKTSWA